MRRQIRARVALDMAAPLSPEFYLRPVLSVADVEASVAYYCDKLGFEPHWSHRDAPDRPLIIAQVGRNDLDLILDGGTAMPQPSRPSVILLALHAVGQLAALYRELEQRGAQLTGPPRPAYWQKGIWVFEAKDLDGNVLSFGADETPELLEAWGPDAT